MRLQGCLRRTVAAGLACRLPRHLRAVEPGIVL